MLVNCLTTLALEVFLGKIVSKSELLAKLINSNTMMPTRALSLLRTMNAGTIYHGNTRSVFSLVVSQGLLLQKMLRVPYHARTIIVPLGCGPSKDECHRSYYEEEVVNVKRTG